MQSSVLIFLSGTCLSLLQLTEAWRSFQNFPLVHNPNYQVGGFLPPFAHFPEPSIARKRNIARLSAQRHQQLLDGQGVLEPTQVRARSAQPSGQPALGFRNQDTDNSVANIMRQEFLPIFNEEEIVEELLNIPDGDTSDFVGVQDEGGQDHFRLPVISVDPDLSEGTPATPTARPGIAGNPNRARNPIQRPSGFRIPPSPLLDDRVPPAPTGQLPPREFTVIPAVPGRHFDEELPPIVALLKDDAGGVRRQAPPPLPPPMDGAYDNIPPEFMVIPAVPSEEFIPPPPPPQPNRRLPPPPPPTEFDFPLDHDDPSLSLAPGDAEQTSQNEAFLARPSQPSAPLVISERQPVPRHSPFPAAPANSDNGAEEDNHLEDVNLDLRQDLGLGQSIQVVIPQRERRKDFKRCHGKCVQAFCIPVDDLDVYQRCVEKCKKPCQ